MNPFRFPTTGLVLIFGALRASAVTDTWDGGDVFDDLSHDANWVDNSAPVSSLTNTDLVFSTDPGNFIGDRRVWVDSNFSAHSIRFAFTDPDIYVFDIENFALSVGSGGIVNSSTSAGAYFQNVVNFSGVVVATVNAGNYIGFFGTVVLPTGTLTVTGSDSTEFTDFSGTGAINKIGAGRMSWYPEVAISQDVTVGAGTLEMGSSLGLTSTFSNTSAVAINGTSTFKTHGMVTLDGAQLARATGAVIDISAGSTFTVQNGGDVVITGAYANTTDSTITVTGAGSSFTGNASLAFNGASSLNVLAGGTVAGSAVNIGTSGDGTASVSGIGSSLSANNLNVGLSGNAGTLIFGSGSTGMFTGISVDASGVAGTSGLMNVQSGASVTGTGLAIATNAVANTGSLTITGTNSMLTLSGAAAATIGAASASTGALNLNSSGAFNSGTGETTVNATGTIHMNGGTYNSNGDLTIIGGTLERLSGTLNLAAGTTFTIQGGGDATFTGPFSNETASTILVTGAGSTLSTTSTFSVNGGSTLTASTGADISTGAGAVNVGVSGNGSVSVTNSGSSLSGGVLNVGTGGNAGGVTFSNGSAGTFGAIKVDDSISADTSGLLQIQSGATVSGTGLSLASQRSVNTGTITITGAGSALTLTGAATATIGAANRSTGTLNLQNGGVFNSGTGLTTVNATGTVAIDSGTYNSNGDLTIDGGQLTRAVAAVFALDAGKTFTVQNGGTANFIAAFTNSTDSDIVVTGAGSTLSSSGNLGIQGGSTLAVAAGGNVSSVLQMNIGTSGGAGTATVDGAGSSLSGDALTVGAGGFAGSLTFTNGSTGSFGGIMVDNSGVNSGVGTLGIQSGAKVTGTSLNVANSPAFNIGIVTIAGAGSTLTLSGPATIGAATNSAGSVNVNSGGTFTTGSGLTTVNATGSININAGGKLTGASDFAGTGPISIAGEWLPGTASGPDQTTSVSIAQNMTFQPTTVITMEIGGTVPGTQHDQLVFNGPGATQVAWNGTLNLVLINGFVPQAGQFFDLLDFDPARDAGTFTTVTVANHDPLPAGLAFDFSELYTTGIIRVVSTGGTTFSQWAATALGDAGALPHGNHDGDAYDNLTEYALAQFPAFPGAFEPAGGFHNYADGERMRMLFWRYLDRTDITIRVQSSSDLTNWNDLAVSVNSAPFTGPGFVSENRAHPLSEPGLVEVRDILTTSTAARRQIRVRIELAP